jgi:hypothetical protein
VRLQEPAVLGQRALDLDRDVLAVEVDLVEAVDRTADLQQRGVDLGDHLGDGDVGVLEALRQRRQGGVRGDGRDARVDRQAEGDDALRSLVRVVLRVLDDLVEQLVHADEVAATDVPVGLLAVDDERLEVDDDGGEELGDPGCELRRGRERGRGARGGGAALRGHGTTMPPSFAHCKEEQAALTRRTRPGPAGRRR